MPKHTIEQQLEELKSLRHAGPTEGTVATLRKTLRDRSNLIVAKSASLISDLNLPHLASDLCRAFEWHLAEAGKSDPQCWAKESIAKALVTFEHAESALFLLGLRHVQMEPVWGGEQDTAITLRGICALALVETTDLPRAEKFRYLTEALTDSCLSAKEGTELRSAPVRVDAARALAQLDGEEAMLLLRLKARAGDVSSSVMGQVFDSLLSLEGRRAVPFVADFLASPRPEVCDEAALSLGISRLPEAVAVLQSAWAASKHRQFRCTLLRAIGASRSEDAFSLLINLLKQGRESDVLDGLSALTLQNPDENLQAQIAAAMAGRTEERLRSALSRVLGRSSP